MKKLFFVLFFWMALAAGAADGPFKRGTTYLNFNLCFIGKPWSAIANPSIFKALGAGESQLIPPDRQKFQSSARGMALEFGLTASLGLEFQYHERSFEYTVYGFSGETADSYTLRDFEGRFRERTLSMGGNYHLNFIGNRRLDVYTGFQLGIEVNNYSVRSDYKYDVKNGEQEISLSPVSYVKPDYIIIYSHIAAGLNYFFTHKIAINLRSGLKLGTRGYHSVFFYGAGLTLNL